MHAFLSYQTADKAVAGSVREVLEGIGISSFLAHEDIQVSHEWRTTLLEELGKVDLFVSILSAGYYQSVWCVQESGIAAFRSDVTIVPLSIDGTLPMGFIGHVQSTRIDPNNVALPSILPGLARRDAAYVVDALTNKLVKSYSYRGAEANFELLLPYLSKATDDQKLRVLQVSAENGQILYAEKCAKKYLPSLFASHGHSLDVETREEVEKVLKAYAK